MLDVFIEGEGRIAATEAMRRLAEHEEQIEAHKLTIRNHEDAVRQCERQISAIRKISEPLRKALVERLGDGS